MTLFLDDGDVRLYHGDALETVRELPPDSVDCVVTSPPYWGLRDYGTGEWDGGDPDCDHVASNKEHTLESSSRLGYPADGGRRRIGADNTYHEAYTTKYRDVCGKCGARRIDRQMGLEPTPDLFVAGMVELFHEIRRVVAPHGTCWVNLGDSYAQASARAGQSNDSHAYAHTDDKFRDERYSGGVNISAAQAGLKPKDLCGIPWRVAFALQADGWWLRSDIIWAKPNPMPESVTDRPTKSHEYVFLLTKQPRYWFDTEAVREPHSTALDDRRQRSSNGYDPDEHRGRHEYLQKRDGNDRAYPTAGRNVRTVWQIATQPYPEELARRCILAGCPVRVCRVCGKPSERIVDTSYEKSPVHGAGSVVGRHYETGANNFDGAGMPRLNKVTETVGWSDCGHNNWRPGVTLDPFIGSGTTAKVARDHQRHAIGIDLNREYLELAARRLQQLSLLNAP